MSTKFLSPSWRMPINANQSKSTNYSLGFDGGNQFINSSPTLSGLTDITVSCWAKFENINNSDFQYVLNAYNTSQSGSYRVGIGMIASNYSTVSDRYKLYTIDGPNLNISSFVVSQDVWYNIVVTQSGTVRKLFVNGDLISTFTGLPSLNLGNNFEIGRFPNNNHYFPGKINSVSIFDYPLSQSQVTTLHGDSTNGPGNPMALPSTPIAYYPLGESAGGFVGGTGTWLTENNAIGDYVFDFVGTSSQEISLTTSNLPSANSSFSMSVWLNRDSTVPSYAGVLSFGDLGSTNVLSMAYINFDTSNNIKYGFYNGDAGNTAISANNWHHVVLTYNGTNATFYINGQVVGIPTQPGTLAIPTTSTLKIGGLNTSAQTFNGKISNAQIFNAVLSGPEVETLYNYGSPIQTLANIPQSSNLKAWYKLDATEIYNLLSVDGFSATDNTGGGGGGGGSRFVSNPLYVGNGGSGGSGIVVLKYPTNLNAVFSAGLTKSDVINGSNTITSIKSGTGTVAFGNAGTISDYLIVAGGGGGGGAVNFSNGEASGGGGGGGGLLTGTSLSVSAQSYNITIGEGGSGGFKTVGGTIGGQGENGQDSIFSTLTAIGGGGGGAGQFGSNALSAGKNGGSGGGPGGSDGVFTYAGGTGSQGSDGGAASNKRAGGGGGGFSNAGTAATSNSAPGNGGNGYLYSLTNTYYAGGGGGGVWYMSGSITDGGSAGDGSTGTGGAPKQQGDITPEGPNFTNWWRILDNSNNSNDGASISMDQSNLVQSDLQTVAPYSKYALNFNGTGDYIDLNSDITLTGNKSVSFWVNFTSTIGGVVFGGASVHYYPYIDATNIYIRAGGSWPGDASSFAHGGLTAGIWYNVCIAGDGTNATAYLNGSSLGTQTDRGFTFKLINGEHTGLYGVDGKLSNCAIWNTALSASEVREIYNEGLPSNLHNFSGAAPVAWWQLGENSSFNGNDWIVADEIGSNNGESDGMGVNALTNGVGTTANGTSTGMSEGSLIGDAPYSTGNAISSGMPVTARGTDVPPTP